MMDRKRILNIAGHPLVWILGTGLFVLIYYLSGINKEQEMHSTLPVMPNHEEETYHNDTLLSPDYILNLLADSQPISVKAREEIAVKKTPPADKETGVKENYSMQRAQTVKASAVSAGGGTRASKTASVKAEKTLRSTDPWAYYKEPSYTAKKRPKALKIAITDTLRVKLITPISTLNYGESAIVSVLDASKSFPGLKDAKLIGKFYALRHSDRVYIQFNRLILKNGESYRISAIAKAFDKKSGISATVDKNIGNDILKAITQTFVRSSDQNSLGGVLLKNTTDKSIENLETNRILSVNAGIRFLAFFDEALFVQHKRQGAGYINRLAIK